MFEPSLRRRPRAARTLATGLLTALLVAFAPTGLAEPATVAGQEGLALSTPFPAVTVQPGDTATFGLSVRADSVTRVDLTVEDVPEGWGTTLRGGGREITAVYADPAAPPEVDLDVDVPATAEAGQVTITVVGRAGADVVRLPIDVNVVLSAGGIVRLTTAVPSVRGTADQAFAFDLDLENDTVQELTFGLSATGPRGWTVTVEPQGESRAASVTVGARGSQRLSVDATPPAQVTSGSYPILVEAVAGDEQVAIELTAEVTGRVEMSFSTADQRLSATATAGQPREIEVTVTNAGTAPLPPLSLSGSGPTDWDVSFDPADLEAVAAGEAATATATITPSGNAVAGDYVVTLRASGEGLNESLEIRVTVETPPIWAIVAIGLIALTLGGMAWVFRRYGRR